MGNDLDGHVGRGYNSGMERVQVTFTLGELWLLHDFIRHDPESQEPPPKYPYVSTKLNEDIALAIVACIDSELDEFTIILDRAEILAIDAWIRRDTKTEDARGDVILLKVFRARYKLSSGFLGDWPVDENTDDDKNYKQALKERKEEDKGNAEPGNNTDNDTDKGSDA